MGVTPAGEHSHTQCANVYATKMPELKAVDKNSLIKENRTQNFFDSRI